MDNITWCGNFVVKADNKEIIDKLEFASSLLFSIKEEVIYYVAEQTEKIKIEYNNNNIGEIDFHTFLFFQDYQKYWQVFGNFEKVNIDIVLEDLFSKNNYLEFDQVNDSKKFFSDLLNYFNNHLFTSNFIEKNPKFIKNLLISYAFKEIFKSTKTNFMIPEKYQEEFLSGISEEKIILYNWNAFRKIFKSISPHIKESYFKKENKIAFILPILKLAYSYSYDDKTKNIIHKTSKQSKVVKNNFEDFFMRNQDFFETMPIEEQKLLFKIFTHHSRKALFEYMFQHYPNIQKDNYSEEEYNDLRLKSQKSTLNIDLDKYFLFKKLNDKLKPINKEKRVKI